LKTLKSNIAKSLFTLALLSVAAQPTLAEPKPTKEVTSLVGYNVTESVAYPEKTSRLFKKIDADGNGEVTFKEFQRSSNLENGYEIFLNMDRDKSKSVNLVEFGSYNRTKGNTQVRSQLESKNQVKGTNLKTKQLETKSYYMPVEPKVVKEEIIN
jgi:hypothetical protein